MTTSTLQVREPRVRGWQVKGERSRSHGKSLESQEFEPTPVWLQGVYLYSLELFGERKPSKMLSELKMLIVCLQTRWFDPIMHKSPKLNVCCRWVSKAGFHNFCYIHSFIVVSLGAFCVVLTLARLHSHCRMAVHIYSLWFPLLPQMSHWSTLQRLTSCGYSQHAVVIMFLLTTLGAPVLCQLLCRTNMLTTTFKVRV